MSDDLKDLLFRLRWKEMSIRNQIAIMQSNLIDAQYDQFRLQVEISRIEEEIAAQGKRSEDDQ